MAFFQGRRFVKEMVEVFIIVLLMKCFAQTASVRRESEINEDLAYQDDDNFKREIHDTIEDLHKSKKMSVFDAILSVNDIHKRWRKDALSKRSLNPDDLINKINIDDDNLLFEGDIALENEELQNIQKMESFRRKRNAVHKRKQIWTTRLIPYYLDPGLSLKTRSTIQKAMEIIHAKTCVRWIPYTSHDHWVHFKKADGCFSTIGRAYAKKGSQILSIGEGCDWLPIVLHEMTHCMGFFHEQSRDDRDRHIKILWENIPDDLQDQFAKYSHGTIDKMKKQYDYKSLMHYSSTAFGINGKTTIVPIDPTQTVGGAEDYTDLDIIEINALYDCKTSTKHSAISSWSQWSECEEKYCYKERQRFCFRYNKNECPKNTNAYGIETEYEKCSSSECPAPIHGHWGMWSSWGICSKSCDEGRRQRSRQCNNPAPSNGGKYCIGEKNDISICLIKRCNIGKYDADFENGWGIWFSDNTAGLIPWAQHSSFTKTLNTGPQGDHTLRGRGMYVYVESSRRKKGDRARLISSSLYFKNPQCLSFYYDMYGKTTGSLTLYMVPEGKPWIDLFKKSGNQGQDWRNADVTLDYRGKFQLVFEVELGGRGYSDTALDDIFIDDGACPGYECKNYNKNCPQWANTGECSRYFAYMLKNCALSCGTCITKSSTAKTKEFVAKTTPKTVQKECKDLNTNCYTWSVKGECEKNPDFMHVNCLASCGLCGDCKNVQVNAQCDVWTKQGECMKNPTYMMVNCKKSCTGCEGQIAVSCSDNNVKCPSWAQTGECKANPDWMSNNCKKSCKKC